MPPGTEPILGMTVLESVGIEVDPRSQTLERLPAVRLKKIRARFSGRLPSGELLLDASPPNRYD